MDVNDIFNAGGILVKNPKYSKSKKNTEPEYITVSDFSSGTVSPSNPIASGAYNSVASSPGVLGETKDLEKYQKHKIPIIPGVDLDNQLADTQGNWTKFGNMLAQTLVSELAIGTVKGFSDLADFVINKAMSPFTDEENDYQNPVSATLQEWQNKFNEEVAPIYVNSGVDIQNGGFGNFGWWMKNIPNVVSSLTLLIPGKAITGVGKLALFANQAEKMGTFGKIGKLTKLDRIGDKVDLGHRVSDAKRWAFGVKKAEDASKYGSTGLAGLRTNIFNPEIATKFNRGAEIGFNAALMRTMENYQEARDVHQETYQTALDTLYNMSDEEYDVFLTKNQTLLNSGININNKDEVAKYIATRAADRTFTMDFGNIVFDIAQLHGLDKIGKVGRATTRTTKNLNKKSIENLGDVVKTAREEATREAEKLATRTAGQTAESAATSAAKGATKKAAKKAEEEIIPKWKKAVNFSKDVAKFNAVTIAEESTEGIEEAVNYISQQEGLTYGKALLKGMADDYEKDKTFGLIKPWSNMQGSLTDYVKNPQLQESAFWGVMGGWIFGGVGGATTRMSEMARTKADIMEQAPDKITGEQTIKKYDWFDLLDLSRERAAIAAIEHRNALIEQAATDIRRIRAGININAKPNPDGTPVMYDSNNSMEQEYAIQKIKNELINDITMEAINSGTYDMLKEYMTSKEMFEAAKELGLHNGDETAQQTIDRIVKHMDNIRQIYNQQSAHVLNQVAAINSEKGTKINIPLQYARTIAFDNTSHILNSMHIDDQIAIANGNIDRLKAAMPDDSQLFEGAGEAAKMLSLIDAYSRLEADKKDIEQTPDSYKKQQSLRSIKDQQKALIKEIKRTSITANADKTVGNIFAAIRRGKHYKKTANLTRPYEYDETGTEATDEQLLKETSDIYKEVFGEELNVPIEDVLHMAKESESNYLKWFDNNSQLYNSNAELFTEYNTLAQLELQKSLSLARVKGSISSIKTEVDYLHNIYNEGRRNLIQLAHDTITKAYQQYLGVNEENGEHIEAAIAAAYMNDKTKARELAEKYMSDGSNGFVTASEFMDALDIINFSNQSNESIYDWITSTIDEIKRRDAKDRKESREKSTENENSISASNNGQVTNPSSNGTKSYSEAAESLQKQSTEAMSSQNDTRQSTNIYVGFNKAGQITTIKQRNKSNATIPARINEDGTIELDVKNLPKNKQVQFIAAGFMIEDDSIRDLMADDWIVAENPVLERNKRGDYTLYQAGRITTQEEQQQEENKEETEKQREEESQETVEEETTEEGTTTETKSEESESTASTPVGSNASTSAVATQTTRGGVIANKSNTTSTKPTSTSAPSTTTINPTPPVQPTSSTSNQTEFKVGDKVDVPTLSIENATISEVKFYTVYIIKDDGTIINVYKKDVKLVSSQPATNSPTGEVDSTSSNHDDSLNLLKTAVIAAFRAKIPNIMADNIDFDSIANEIRKAMLSKLEENDISEEELDTTLNAQKDALVKAHATIKAMPNAATQSAAAMSMASRFEEINAENFSQLFTNTINTFLEEYKKIRIVPEIDGKQVVDIAEVLRICNSTYSSSDSSVARLIYEAVVAYLKQNQDKYVIINDSEEAINNSVKSEEQISEETLGETEVFPINLDDLYSEPEDYDSEKVAQQEALAKINKGDKVKISQDRDGLVVKFENTIIGTLGLPKVVGISYSVINSGWVTDVRLDENGVPISRSKDRIARFFTAEGKDYDNLRQLLTKAKNLPKNSKEYKELIKEFQNNPLIKNLIDEAKAEIKNKTNLIYINKDTNEPDINRVFDYLEKLWNYSTLSTRSTDKQDNINTIIRNLNRWFKKLYITYDTVSAISGEIEVPIEGISEGQIIRVSDTPLKDYNQLPLATEGLADLENSRLSIVDNTSHTLFVSGRNSLNEPSFSYNSTIITIFSRNNEPDYVKAIGVKYSEYMSNGAMWDLANYANIALHQALTRTYVDMMSANGEKIAEAIQSIVKISGDNNHIPFFIPTAGTFSIENINHKNAKGINILYRGKDGTLKRFNILYNDFNNTHRLGYGTLDINGKMEYHWQGSRNNQSAGETANAIIREFQKFLIDCDCQFNISLQGVQSDNAQNTNYKGFINRKDGKTVITVPVWENGKYEIGTIEYDSYNDFVIKTNLIRVNTKKSQNGTNFDTNTTNTLAKQKLFVSLPIRQTRRQVAPIDETKQNTGTGTNNTIQYVEEGSDANLISNLINAIDSNKSNVSTEIISTILPASLREEFESILSETNILLDEILPKRIQYSDKMNDYSEPNKPKGAIAYSNAQNDKSFHTYKNGKSTQRFKKDEHIAVGDRWLNMASSNKTFRRKLAINKLIHEQLHIKIGNMSNEEKQRLFDNITPIFAEFKSALIKRLENLDKNSKQYKALDNLKKNFDAYEGNKTKLYEEFLTESLTNVDLVDFLNSVESEGVTDNKKKETLFDKIIKLIAKWFGINIKDDSLLQKEINMLREIADYNNAEDAQTPEAKKELNEIKEEEKKESPIYKIKERPKDEDIDENDDDLEDNYLASLRNDDDVDYDSDIDWDTDETMASIFEEVAIISENGFVNIDNADSFKATLPTELRSKFQSYLDNGAMEIRCR